MDKKPRGKLDKTVGRSKEVGGVSTGNRSWKPKEKSTRSRQGKEGLATCARASRTSSTSSTKTRRRDPLAGRLHRLRTQRTQSRSVERETLALCEPCGVVACFNLLGGRSQRASLPAADPRVREDRLGREYPGRRSGVSRGSFPSGFGGTADRAARTSAPPAHPQPAPRVPAA